jgi:hypothetical protein
MVRIQKIAADRLPPDTSGSRYTKRVDRKRETALIGVDYSQRTDEIST